MSELRWNWVYFPYLDAPNKQKESALNAGYIKVVSKDEADEVIAEKVKELRHHKYKRCLDKAEIFRQEWCTLYYERKKYIENPFLDHLMSRKNRHKEKWLALAEKFKANV